MTEWKTVGERQKGGQVPYCTFSLADSVHLAASSYSDNNIIYKKFNNNTHQRGEECLGHAGHLGVLPVPHAHGDAGDVPLDLHHVVEDEVAQHAQAAPTDG